MKVLLVQDVDNLGLAGEVHNVADGYGRNFLLPRGLAVKATPGAMVQADLHRRRAAEKRQREAEELTALAQAINGISLEFRAKAGETGRLYGSITTAEIAEKLSEAVQQEIDRRKIQLDGTIKQLGSHQIMLRLSADVTAEFEVRVQPLEGEGAAAPEAAVPEEEAAAAEAAEEEALVEEEQTEA
jgi:large subunit ribosomal protein L9